MEARIFITLASPNAPGGGGELFAFDGHSSDDRGSDRLTLLLCLPGLAKAAVPEPFRKGPILDASDELELEDFVGRLAGELVTEGTFDMVAHRHRIRAFAREARGENSSLARRKWFRVTLAVTVIAAGILAFLGWQRHQRAVDASERFGFERDANGWVALSSEQGGGCVAVRRSEAEAKRGEFALELDMVLDGTRESRRSGEVAWDALEASHGHSMPNRDVVDLRGKTVGVWVYATAGAEGDAQAPNGFQLFVKDGQWRSQYGVWVNVEPERWLHLTLDVGKRLPGTHLDDGFDVDKVRLIGLKMSVGGESQSSFEGPVFVDAVTW